MSALSGEKKTLYWPKFLLNSNRSQFISIQADWLVFHLPILMMINSVHKQDCEHMAMTWVTRWSFSYINIFTYERSPLRMNCAHTLQHEQNKQPSAHEIINWIIALYHVQYVYVSYSYYFPFAFIIVIIENVSHMFSMWYFVCTHCSPHLFLFFFNSSQQLFFLIRAIKCDSIALLGWIFTFDFICYFFLSFFAVQTIITIYGLGIWYLLFELHVRDLCASFHVRVYASFSQCQ